MGRNKRKVENQKSQIKRKIKTREQHPQLKQFKIIFRRIHNKNN